MNNQTLKCVAVGDAAVGKTCLLVSYAAHQFQAEYQPTVFETYAVTVDVGNKPHTLALFDTAGKEEYERLRPLSCPQTHVFLVCFSLTSPTSLHSATQKWIPHIREYCPNTPYYLVGTKLDLLDEVTTPTDQSTPHRRSLTTEQGKKIAKRSGAVGYVECSALTQKGVNQLFSQVITTAISPPKPRRTWQLCIS